MTAEVVGLRGSVMPIEPTVIPDVVKTLENLLSQAKAGEITCIAFVTLHPGDITGYWRSGRQVRSLLGAIELLKYDMCRADD